MPVADPLDGHVAQREILGVLGDPDRWIDRRRDDLQSVIALLKDSGTELPLQYENFRD